MKELTIEGYRKPISKKNKMKFNRKHGRAYKDKSVREGTWRLQESFRIKSKS